MRTHPNDAPQGAGPVAARRASRPRTEARPGRVVVSYRGGESYAAATRGHSVLTDQPATAGGDDAAMTPVELLIAALSSCAAFYAGRYLARHGLNRDGLHVTATFTTATDRPARVAGVRLAIRVPGGVPPNRQAALLAVASHCTVHNTLRHPHNPVGRHRVRHARYRHDRPRQISERPQRAPLTAPGHC